MKIGYARVSTGLQDAGRQRMDLEVYGCERIFEDTASGAKSSRPAFDKMLLVLQAGDELVIQKLDRLGRNTRHLVNLLPELTERGVRVISLTESVDFTTPMGRLVFHVLAAVAALEREMIMERTADKKAKMRAKGLTIGKRPGVKAKLALELIRAGVGRDEVIRSSGVSVPTYYRIMRTVRCSDLPA